MAIRVIIADDHPIVLHGLQQLFARAGDFEIVAACANGEDALAAVRTRQADVLVLDLRMPGMSGLAVLRAIAADGLTMKTVLLSAAVQDEQVVQAVQLGVLGVVLKESPPEELLACVRKVSQGLPCLESDTMARAFNQVLKREAPVAEGAALTPRELEIVRMVSEGLRNKEIGERLSISEGTVKVHLHNVYEKLGVDGRLELLLFAQSKGLV